MAAVAKINTQALRHNLSCVRRLAPNSQVMAMVKANAYGHGMVAVARQMERIGCPYFGLAYLEEGIQLRRAGISTSNFVSRAATSASMPVEAPSRSSA